MKRDYRADPPGQAKQAERRCDVCGETLEATARVCSACGAAVRPKMADRMETK